jgi:hypothetical protein
MHLSIAAGSGVRLLANVDGDADVDGDDLALTPFAGVRLRRARGSFADRIASERANGEPEAITRLAAVRHAGAPTSRSPGAWSTA